MKKLLFLIVALGLPNQLDAGTVTASVEVFDSSPGEFVPLELGGSRLGYKDRYIWTDIPSLLEEQPLNIWRVNGYSGLGGDPIPEYGIISFSILSDGPVWMAVMADFGGGGNPSGDWIPELSSRVDLEAAGWTEIATSLTFLDQSTSLEDHYIIFERQSLIGESFTYRTHKYHPPLLLTTQFNSTPEVPEPTSMALAMSGLACIGGFGIRRRRRNRPRTSK